MEGEGEKGDREGEGANSRLCGIVADGHVDWDESEWEEAGSKRARIGSVQEVKLMCIVVDGVDSIFGQSGWDFSSGIDYFDS